MECTMGKATGEYTSEPLPLDDDDPNWLSLEDAVQLLIERRKGDGKLAADKLTEALGQEGLRCMYRPKVAGGKYTLLPHEKWTALRLMVRFPKAGFRVSQLQDRRSLGRQSTFLQPIGWIFFVWQPDFDKLWPPRAAGAPVDPSSDVQGPPDGKPPPNQPPKLTPLAWFNKALKDYPRQRGEPLIEYARRLFQLMKVANLTTYWKFDTLRRRLDDK